MRYFVVNDMKSNTREAFVCTEDEWKEISNNYSGYYIEKILILIAKRRNSVMTLIHTLVCLVKHYPVVPMAV